MWPSRSVKINCPQQNWNKTNTRCQNISLSVSVFSQPDLTWQYQRSWLEPLAEESVGIVLLSPSFRVRAFQPPSLANSWHFQIKCELLCCCADWLMTPNISNTSGAVTEGLQWDPTLLVQISTTLYLYYLGNGQAKSISIILIANCNWISN